MKVSERLAVELPGLQLKNPIMPASGCFGFGDNRYAKLYDLNKLGALVIKSTTLKERVGNPAPQIAWAGQNVLNSVGLKNPGVKVILEEKLPALRTKYPKLPLIGSVAGATVSEYTEVARLLSTSGLVDALELNISCPNVHEGGMLFGTDPKIVAVLTRAVKDVSRIPVYVKLTPNVTDIVSVAEAVENAGADGLSMINTLLGMKIDVQTRQSVLGSLTGGLSGPGIKPIAIRMIHQVSHAVSLPIIGLGGVETAVDVIEMYLAGASAVAIGTAHFNNPTACADVVDALPQEMDKLGISSLSELISQVRSEH
ncbi:dihydroorotate dehydrogenase [Liquorilactobacillus oeni]|uniref:Dihydroorotate dehydrogenase n=1 Tax=Liquorilactobacillus oeni DSM 19972 TaxID=1423777 RepID=A0A0R1MHA3_9LACO|nr:dihydroorotate dehydrogenase [Liquorilactobacillus oeni]KRL04594.1 dihydroorotate dehydrogenase 1B [Liquorilactobacillus oeni DSM 19972]